MWKWYDNSICILNLYTVSIGNPMVWCPFFFFPGSNVTMEFVFITNTVGTINIVSPLVQKLVVACLSVPLKLYLLSLIMHLSFSYVHHIPLHNCTQHTAKYNTPPLFQLNGQNILQHRVGNLAFFGQTVNIWPFSEVVWPQIFCLAFCEYFWKFGRPHFGLIWIWCHIPEYVSMRTLTSRRGHRGGMQGLHPPHQT